MPVVRPEADRLAVGTLGAIDRARQAHLDMVVAKYSQAARRGAPDIAGDGDDPAVLAEGGRGGAR
jgi:hypothetical protein